MTAIARYMVDTITIARETGVDVNGDPSFSAPFTAKARVEAVTNFTAGINDDRIQIDWAVATETEIRTTDRVWLPDDDLSSAGRRPSSVRHARRPGGGGHYEVTF